MRVGRVVARQSACSGGVSADVPALSGAAKKAGSEESLEQVTTRPWLEAPEALRLTFGQGQARHLTVLAANAVEPLAPNRIPATQRIAPRHTVVVCLSA